MKRRSILGIAGAVAATLVITGSAFAASAGITNGGFENGDLAAGSPGYQTLDADASELGPWSISGSVDWISTYWTAAEGSKSIDLNGLVPGAISQTIDTTVGKTYVVAFQLAGNPEKSESNPALKTMTVGATGNTATSYSFDSTGKWLDNMGWVAKGYSFKATSNSTTITFTSTTAGYYGPAVDDVKVIAPVATGADCKSNGWKRMTDSVGHSFKNQGDCVSFFATDGKNLAAV